MTHGHWLHGSFTLDNAVVEVRESFNAPRGKPKESLGWKARIDLKDIVIETAYFCDSRSEAEEVLSEALHGFIDKVNPPCTKPHDSFYERGII